MLEPLRSSPSRFTTEGGNTDSPIRKDMGPMHCIKESGKNPDNMFACPDEEFPDVYRKTVKWWAEVQEIIKDVNKTLGERSIDEVERDLILGSPYFQVFRNMTRED